MHVFDGGGNIVQDVAHFSRNYMYMEELGVVCGEGCRVWTTECRLPRNLIISLGKRAVKMKRKHAADNRSLVVAVP